MYNPWDGASKHNNVNLWRTMEVKTAGNVLAEVVMQLHENL
jgi:hypothetical protein